MRNGKISRRLFVVGGGLALLSCYLFYGVKSVAVTKYTIPIANLPPSFDGFTILHLTDLHSKEYGERQKRLLNLIKQHEFDIVAFTGDLVDKHNPETEPAISLIKGLPREKPVFFVPGNHDWWANYNIKEPLLAEGVQILENSNHRLYRDGASIWLSGVDDPFLGKDDLPAALAGSDATLPRILLAHAPNIFSSAVKAGVDLVLVGHTHGGQVRLPFLGAVIVPGQGFFPEFDYGMFNAGSTAMVINGGLGESVLPVRFLNRPEIVLVTLKAPG